MTGLTRAAFDEIGSGPFEEHQEEHSPWKYLFYIAHLRSTPETEMNGVEAYVWHKLEHEPLSWVPTRTSWRIEHSLKLPKAEDSEKKMNDFMQRNLAMQDHLCQELKRCLEKQDNLSHEVKALALELKKQAQHN